MKNFFGAFIILLIGLGITWLILLSLQKAPDSQSSATSNVSYPAETKATGLVRADTPQPITNKTTSVTCTLGATLVTNKDGTKQAKFTWNYTPGTYGYIDQGTGFTPSNTDVTAGGDLLSDPITEATTFTLRATSGLATSTCAVRVDPTTSIVTPQ